MTTELFVPADPMTISGLGPYPIPHEYSGQDDIQPIVQTSSGTQIFLAASDFTLDPVSSEVDGDLYLTSDAAALYDGATIFPRRKTEVQQGWAGVAGPREIGLERELDRQARALQDLYDLSTRTPAFLMPAGDVTLPPMQAGRGYVANATTDGFDLGPDQAEIAAASENAEAALAARLLAEAAAGSIASTWAVFAVRNAINAAALVALGAGAVGIMAGYIYAVDIAATGAASALNDLGVDGLVPYGTPEPGHYGDPLSGTALQSLVANGGAKIRIPGGTYVMAQGLDLSAQTDVDLHGDVTLDFTGITDHANVPGEGYVSMVAGTLTALPALAADISAGATSFTLASAPDGVAAGDWITLYDSANFSFSAYRTYYRQGQQVRVARISGATITIFDTILGNLPAATCDVYLHPMGKIAFGGSGNMILRESQADTSELNSKAGVYAYGYEGLDLSKIKSMQPDYGCMLIDQCINVFGSGYKTTQVSGRTAGLNYGIVFANCQNVEIHGDFRGYRHAVTVGGNSNPGAVPCRFITVTGTASSHPDTSVGAVNFHGNSEYCTFAGFIDGGFSAGGNHHTVRGTIRARGQMACVYLNEMQGADWDFAGCKMETLGNPHAGSSAVVNIGVNYTTALCPDTIKGGVINLSNVTMNAPNAERGLGIRNRGCTQGVAIDVAGMAATLAGGGIHYVDVVSGSNFAEFAMHGARLGTTELQNIKHIDVVSGWEVRGYADLTPSTGASSVSAAIAFKTPAGKIPVITPAISNTTGLATVGGKRCTALSTSILATSANLVIQTTDGANFADTVAGRIAYRITV